MPPPALRRPSPVGSPITMGANQQAAVDALLPSSFTAEGVIPANPNAGNMASMISAPRAPDPTDLSTPGGAPPSSNPADSFKNAPTDPRSEFNRLLEEEFLAASGGKRKPRQDELDQWWGYSQDGPYKDAAYAWAPGQQFTDYMKKRVGMHSRGDYNGDNPAELPSWDEVNRSKALKTAGPMMASQAQWGNLDGLLSGDPIARISQAIGTINGNGQVNLDALLRQLQGVG